MIHKLLTELNLARSQIKPNMWVLMVSFCILWKMALGPSYHPSVKEFLAFYRPAKFGHGWSFQGCLQFIIFQEKWHPGNNFEWGFFFISSTYWELSTKERYIDTLLSVPVTWGTPCKSRLGALLPLSYAEKSIDEKVCKWANDHPNKLQVDQLSTEENLELHLGYPQGKWPSAPSDPHAVRAPMREDPPAKLSLQVKKRKSRDKGGESSSKRSHHESHTSTFGEILAQGKGLNFDTVTLPKLALANLVESLAIHPVEPTCDQMGNHHYKNVRVNVKEGE
jgi:hypothetical protein